MVTISALNGLPLRMGSFVLSQSLYGTVVQQNSTSVSFDMTGVFSDTSNMINRFNGFGLFYDEENDRFEGVVTSFEHLTNGVVDFRLSSLNIAASDLAGWVSNNRGVDGIGARFFLGDDSITGSANDDSILGYAGNDTITAGAGDDRINAESPSIYPQSVKGTHGNAHDLVFGGEGSDYIIGGGGNDHLYGFGASAGIDGNDTIDGGEGADYIQGNAGQDSLDGGDGSDRMQGGAENDLMLGGTGNDSMNGNRGDDYVQGGGGHDSLRGGQGNDTIAGGGGDDILAGDLGIDILTGGADRDIFQFGGDASLFAGAGADVVGDFENNIDRFQVGYAVQAVLSGAEQGSFASAANLAQQLFDGQTGTNEVAAIEVGTSTYIFYSSNNGGLADSAVELAATAASEISLTDFI